MLHIEVYFKKPRNVELTEKYLRRYWYANIYYWEIKCFIIIIVKKNCVLFLEPGNIENRQLQSSLEDYDFFMIIGELNN